MRVQAAAEDQPEPAPLVATIDGENVLFTFARPVALRALRVSSREMSGTVWWDVGFAGNEVSSEGSGESLPNSLADVFSEFKQAIEREPIEQSIKWVVYGAAPHGLTSMTEPMLLFPGAYEVIAIADEGRYCCEFIVPEREPR